MKKYGLISLILCVCMLVSCAAGSGAGSETTTEAQTTEPVETEEPIVKKNRDEITVAFLGDSITLGYALDDQHDRFSTVICDKLGVKEENYGITGTLVAKAGMNRNDDKSYVDRKTLIKDADIAVIFGGTNDYFHSDTPIYPEEGDTEAGNDYFIVALDEICKYVCENRNPKMTILITPYNHFGHGNYKDGKIYNIENDHPTSDKNFVDHTLEDYAKAIVAKGEEYGIPVLDLQALSTFDYKTMTVDGCHPNPEGHKWIVDQLTPMLKEMVTKMSL